MTDRELVRVSTQKAGTQKALAKVFGVSQSAVSEWGRTRGIPRHVRPRLESYIGQDDPNVTDRAKAGQNHCSKDSTPSGLSELTDIGRGIAREIGALPKKYRKRYEARLADVIERLRRELEEYRDLLNAEHRLKAGRKRGSTRR